MLISNTNIFEDVNKVFYGPTYDEELEKSSKEDLIREVKEVWKIVDNQDKEIKETRDKIKEIFNLKDYSDLNCSC